MQTSSKASIRLFIVSFALVFYGTGASFVESFVNYPTWRLIGPNEFPAYHHALSPLIITFMVAPMLIGTGLTISLLWFRPGVIPRRALAISIVLQLIIWISTATVQIPIQIQLSNEGLSLPLVQSLIFTNLWMRKLPQIINVLLYFWMMSRLLRVNYGITETDGRRPNLEER